jgi:hypothetical protein
VRIALERFFDTTGNSTKVALSYSAKSTGLHFAHGRFGWQESKLYRD